MTETATLNLDGRRRFRLPAFRAPAAEAAIAKLNRRAKKLGCGLIGLTKVGEERVSVWACRCGRTEFPAGNTCHSCGTLYDLAGKRTYHLYEVEGESPVIEGWEFLAALDHFPRRDEDGKRTGYETIVRSAVEDAEGLFDSYRGKGPGCDHCGTKRYRKVTYIVRHTETDETKEVGSTCVSDFTGHKSPEALLAAYELLLKAVRIAEGDEEFYGGSCDPSYDLAEVIHTAAYVSRTDGRFITRREANETNSHYATSDGVGAYLNSAAARDERERECGAPTDADAKLAERVYGWLEELGGRADLRNDYLINLATVARLGYVPDHRHLGLAVSALAAYKREMEFRAKREADAKAREKNGPSEYVGEPKKREHFDLTLKLIREWDGMYGTTHFYKFEDPNGNVLAWYASKVATYGPDHEEIRVGHTYRVLGTVKAHKEYKDEKTTTINRCKIEDELAGAKEAA